MVEKIMFKENVLHDIAKEILSPDKGFIISNANVKGIEENNLNILMEIDYSENKQDSYPLCIKILDESKEFVLVEVEISSVLKTATTTKREFVIQDIIKKWLEENEVEASAKNAAILFDYKKYKK